MSTPQRRQPTSVIDRLFEEPHRFEFFQAVRQLERWFMREEQLSSATVLSQRVVFRNSLSLAFPASEIAEFKVAATAAPTMPDGTTLLDGIVDATDRGRTEPPRPSRAIQRIEMTPAFMGLLGAGGTLPVFYTELFAQRELHQKDTAARAFMDIFLHRAVVLFYEAWRKHRMAVEFEADRRHGFLPLVLAVAGIGHKSMRDRLRAPDGGVSDGTLAFFAGALQHRPPSAMTIRRVLERYFGVAVKLDQFVGRWFRLPQDNQTILGLGNATLGRGAVAGERVWQRDLRMRLTIGPMARDKFRRFLPGGPAELALRELLTMFTGVGLEYEVRLSLRASDVKPSQLAEGHGPLLGWDSFLVTRPAPTDRTDPGYDIHAIA